MHRLCLPINTQYMQTVGEVENAPGLLISQSGQDNSFLAIKILRRDGIHSISSLSLGVSVCYLLWTHRGPHSYSGLYNWPKKD